MQCVTNRGQYPSTCVLLSIDPLLCNIYPVETQQTNVVL